MTDPIRTTWIRFWLWPIRLIGVIAPRRLRADWRQEWEAELLYRETLLAEWDRLNWRTKLDLLRRSLGALWDALLLQPRRLEDEMFQDLRYGVRILLKHKGFTAVAALTLALGIGANTAIFSLVYAVVFRPLPYRDPGQLVRLKATLPRKNAFNMTVSYPTFRDWREQSAAFTQVAAYASGARGLNLTGGDRPERLSALDVSRDIFSLLGINPALGRTFVAEEETQGARVVVMSHELWRRRFQGDPNLIGKTVTLDDQAR